MKGPWQSEAKLGNPRRPSFKGKEKTKKLKQNKKKKSSFNALRAWEISPFRKNRITKRCCPSLFCYCDEDHEQKQVGKERVYVSSQVLTTAAGGQKSGQEVRQR